VTVITIACVNATSLINGKQSHDAGGMPTNSVLLKIAVRVWLMEILVSGFNFFVLMNLVYEPRWRALVAHQI
jgi:hypothetical protein